MVSISIHKEVAKARIVNKKKKFSKLFVGEVMLCMLVAKMNLQVAFLFCLIRAEMAQKLRGDATLSPLVT